MRKKSKLRKTREARGFRAYEMAEQLGMSCVRYMAIEMDCWEEPTEEEVLSICAFFRMDVQSLGFGSKFWSLSLHEGGAVCSSHTSGKKE